MPGSCSYVLVGSPAYLNLEGQKALYQDDSYQKTNVAMCKSCQPTASQKFFQLLEEHKQAILAAKDSRPRKKAKLTEPEPVEPPREKLSGNVFKKSFLKGKKSHCSMCLKYFPPNDYNAEDQRKELLRQAEKQRKKLREGLTEEGEEE